MTLEELKLFCRIDSSDEDTDLISLQLAAEQDLLISGIAKDYDSSLYVLAIKFLVNHWHENREATGDNKILPFGLNDIIIKLKCSQG